MTKVVWQKGKQCMETKPMTSTVDIDSKLDKILIRARINNNTPRQVYIGDVKSLIREVAEEVTPELKPIVKGTANDDWYLGYNDCINDTRTKLNKLLGEK